MQAFRPLLKTTGSLWLAAAMLIVLMAAMGSATIYETTHGAEQALVKFYHSWWFRLILALVAVNILSAMLLRFPFKKKQLGFVLAHSGILLTLAGAWVTDQFAVNGRVGFYEDETVKDFSDQSQETLAIINQTTQEKAHINLPSSIFGQLAPVARPPSPKLQLDPVSIKVMKYLPDISWERSVLNDSPHLHPAIEVSLSPEKDAETTWVFASQISSIESRHIAFRLISDRAELKRLLDNQNDDQSLSKGMVKITLGDTSFDLSLTDCLDKAIPLKDTEYTIHVLRYLPHATVGPDNKVSNTSNQPVNPAIEFEITGPDGKDTRLAFAKFPDFGSMHKKKILQDLKVTFLAPIDITPAAPIEVLSGPDGDMYVRFLQEGSNVVCRKLNTSKAVEIPQSDKKLYLLQRYDNARVKITPQPVDPVRKERMPAVLISMVTGDNKKAIWLQKYRPLKETVNGATYELYYGNAEIPLNFSIRLNKFHLRTYPGGRRHRSYESHVTISNPVSGETTDRIIKMNHPYSYGWYTLYQSSYMQEGKRSASFLSVSYDPGQPFVFAGYLCTMVGMLVVLITRMNEKRRQTTPT